MVLYPGTLREIEEALVQCHAEDAYGVWNEFIEAFELSDKTVRRRLSSLEDEMPIGWSPYYYCRKSDKKEDLTHKQQAILKSLETELERHGLQKYMIGSGWYDLAYNSY